MHNSILLVRRSIIAEDDMRAQIEDRLIKVNDKINNLNNQITEME